MSSIASSRPPRRLLPNLWAVLPQHSVISQPEPQTHSQFIRAPPRLMADDSAATQQPLAPPSGDGGQASASQGTPAALVTPLQLPATSDTVQSDCSGQEATSTHMGSAASAPATSSTPPLTSSGALTIATDSSNVTTPSGVVGVTLSLPAATSTPLAASSSPSPPMGMPAALLQLAAAAGGGGSSAALLQLAADAGGGSATPRATATMQTASTTQYTPSLGPLTRPVPMLGAGTLPAPTVAQFPASIFDIQCGATLVGMPDGLARSVPLPYFSDGELARLSALGGVDHASELLQAYPLRLVNFSDAHVRLAAKREMLALARCYDVEGFASRVMNTTHLLQLTTQLVQTLEAQPTTQADSRALISLLRTECAGLVGALTKERNKHAATTKLLADERSHSQQQTASATMLAEVDALRSEVGVLKSVAGQLSSEKVDLQAQLRAADTKFDELQRKDDTALKGVGELETRLASTNVFSPDMLMDFIAGNATLGGHWKRLHKLLQTFRDGSPVPSAFRTSIQISARDEDTDDCGPYVLQSTSRSSSQSADSQASVPRTSGPAQRSTQSPTPSAAAKPTISFGDKPVRQVRRLSLTGSPSKGSPPWGAAAGQTNQSEAIDLTGSTPSTPRGHRVMLLADRLKLPTRPSVFKPLKVRALKQSRDRVSLYYAQRAIPAPYSWDWTRADVREFLFTGSSFWDAVAEVQKLQMLHDQFGRQTLIHMLVSATYWRALDRTPWMSYVPDAYFQAAWEILQDPAMAEIPEPWEPLPIKPAPGSPDSGRERLHSSDDGEDDDKFDKTYRAKGTQFSSSSSTRSQSGASGKRPRGSGPSGKGSATKVAKTSSQTSASATRRPKAKLPAPLPDDGVIEMPKKGSWRHYGIKVQTISRQTMGFPSYIPVQPLLQHLHVRWCPIEYWELIQTCPWDNMWTRRITSLVFFKYSDMSFEMAETIKIILDFMSRWRREYWERYHWVTMDPDFDYYRTPELRAIPELADLYRDRKDRHSDFDNHRKKMMAEVEKTPGYNERIWFEPGLWVVPQNPCYWIIRDPKLQILLRDQLAVVDELEPAETQWVTRRSDNAFLNLAHATLANQLLSDSEQIDNLLIPNHKYDHDTLAAVLAEVSKKNRK